MSDLIVASTPYSPLKIFPLFQGNFPTYPAFNLTEKHLNLWNRIFFVAWQSECICAVTHIEMTSPRFRRFETKFLQLLYEISSLAGLPLTYERLSL